MPVLLCELLIVTENTRNTILHSSCSPIIPIIIVFRGVDLSWRLGLWSRRTKSVERERKWAGTANAISPVSVTKNTFYDNSFVNNFWVGPLNDLSVYICCTYQFLDIETDGSISISMSIPNINTIYRHRQDISMASIQLY